MISTDAILRKVRDYYNDKIETHGANHRGVDWPTGESQTLRFDQLIRLIDEPAKGFSVNDYGCGYGALAQYLVDCGFVFNYTGFDISDSMIYRARELSDPIDNRAFTTDHKTLAPTDYSFCSGVFNVKLDIPVADWEQYVFNILDQAWQYSTKGLAFNMLTKYSDPERMRSDLYYADPGRMFAYCKTHFSRYVALLHDYELYEFTILVRR